MYGLMVKRKPPHEDEAFWVFSMMETAVFFLEDGAAILLLAKSTGEMDVVETISMYLTVACGLCYIGYFLLDVVRGILEDGLTDDGSLFFIVISLLAGGSAAFQTYILVSKVILSSADDAPLSGGLEIAAYAVYGVTAAVFGGFTMLGFAFG